MQHFRLLSILVLFALPATTFGIDAVMMTRSWQNDNRAFGRCHKRIAAMRGRNLLARSGVTIVDAAGLPYGTAKMLFDGSAGVRVSNGRVGLNGKPAVLTLYLGEPKVISQVNVKLTTKTNLARRSGSSK